MKIIGLFGLSAYLLTTVSASAQLTETVFPTLNSSWYTHLTELNQSQTIETLSMADRSSGLPANSYQTAAVHFIAGNSGQNFGETAHNNDFADATIDSCQRYGYTVTSCASGLFNQACPYNDRIYDRCCDAAYKYAASQCPSPKILSSDTCGGKYKCYCSSSTYPFAACNAPQIKGSSCTDDNGTRYQTCSCPAGVSTPYGCQEYYASPCNSVCKTAYVDNCRNRTAVQTPYGCASFFSDCSSKCQTAYPDNCRNRNHNDYGYGCQQYYSDCQSKCEIALTRPSCRIGDIFYSDNTCVAAENHNSSKQVLGIVIYVNPNGVGGQIMAVGNYGGNMVWASTCKDIPTLAHKTPLSTAITDFDSCGNTNKIVAYGSSSAFPAAWKAREYAPTTATKGKWCLPAAGVLYSANVNYSKISKALNLLGGVYIFSPSMKNQYYWTSTQGENTKGTYRAQDTSNWTPPKYGYNIEGAAKGYSCGASNGGYLKPVLEF